jgi:RNA polymerase sigma-70 factor (ECF subfamily)
MSQDDYNIIWENLNKDLRSFIFSRIKNDSDIDDLLQEVYIRIHDNIHGLKESTKIKPWVYQITRNLIADHFRKKNIQISKMELRDWLPASSSSTNLMDTAIRDMSEIMNELPPDYCEALCMIEIEGISQKEYAELKGISYSGAKSRVQRARILLKDMLLKCCHYHFDKYGTVYDIRPKCCCC